MCLIKYFKESIIEIFYLLYICIFVYLYLVDCFSELFTSSFAI